MSKDTIKWLVVKKHEKDFEYSDNMYLDDCNYGTDMDEVKSIIEAEIDLPEMILRGHTPYEGTHE